MNKLALLFLCALLPALCLATSVQIVSNGKYVNIWPNDSRLIFLQYASSSVTNWVFTPVAGSTTNEYTIYDPATSRYWRAVNSSGFRVNLSAGPATDNTFYFKMVPVSGSADTYNIVNSYMENLYNYYNGGLSLTSCECEFYFNGGQTFVVPGLNTRQIKIVSNSKFVNIWPNDSRLIFVQYSTTAVDNWEVVPVSGSTTNEYTIYNTATSRYWRAVNSSGFRMNLSAGPATDNTYYFKLVPVSGTTDTFNIVNSYMENLYNYYNGGLSLTSCECEFYFNGGQTFQLITV